MGTLRLGRREEIEDEIIRKERNQINKGACVKQKSTSVGRCENVIHRGGVLIIGIFVRKRVLDVKDVLVAIILEGIFRKVRNTLHTEMNDRTYGVNIIIIIKDQGKSEGDPNQVKVKLSFIQSFHRTLVGFG